MTSKIILAGVALIFIVVGVLPLMFKKQAEEIKSVIRPSKPPIASQSAGEPLTLPLQVPTGYKIGVFAKGLGAPRDLEFSPGGILLASITSQGKVVALPDANNDGIADKVVDVIKGLNNVHGIAFHQDKLFAAGEKELLRYNWDEASMSATLDKKILDLPAGGRHFTRSIVFNKKGQLFISIGSTCDVCVEKDLRNGSVMVTDMDGNNPRIYAQGLRNSVFLAVNPKTQELWGTEMGRDGLGKREPNDEINIIKEDKDYGWPYCYDDQIPDISFDKQSTKSTCENTELPAHNFDAHSAPLGLAFINTDQFFPEWQGDILVALHGSTNIPEKVGYRVVRRNVEGSTTLKGGEDNIITGFLDGSTALARPVDLIFDKAGSLYVSDDKAGNIFKVVRQ